MAENQRSTAVSTTPEYVDDEFDNPALKLRRGAKMMEAIELIDITGDVFDHHSSDLNLTLSGHMIQGEDPEEKPKEQGRNSSKQQRTPLERFRAIATTVKHNLMWARWLSRTDDEKSFVVQHEDGTFDQNMTFNVNAFKANVQSINTLPYSAKRIMMKNSFERTPDELHYLVGFVSKLKCFERYSLTVKQELSAVLYYESFNEGRVIVRQGHPGLSFYFILSGSVTAEVTDIDQRTGEKITHAIAEFTAGSSFGELALLHGGKRTATIVCKVDSEFLRLDKPDFDMVLRRSYQHEWDMRMSALRSSAAFGEWDEEELRATNDRARLVEFMPNSIILGDIDRPPDNIYFIKSGECKIARQVTLVQTKMPFGKTTVSLPPLLENHKVDPSFTLNSYQSFIEKILQITVIGKGKFFGVGEDLRRTYILAVGKVECLLVSRVAFMRHDRGRILLDMKESIKNMYPTYERTFESFLADKKWKHYKQSLVKELVEKRRIPNDTSVNDVPYVLRSELSALTPHSGLGNLNKGRWKL